MSILIKNMEMPKYCGECPMVCAYDLSRKARSTEKAENCPLIEIPPHGRLIDADEFLKRAIGTKCFRGDFALLLEELVGESTTIIEAEGEDG